MTTSVFKGVAHQRRAKDLKNMSRWIHVFVIVGAFYPMLRIELIERVALPSPVLGAWVDLLSFILLFFIFCTNRTPTRQSFVALTVLFIFIAGLLSSLFASDLVSVAYGFRQTYLPIIFFFVGLHLGRDWIEVERLWILLVVVFAGVALSGVVLSFVFPEYWTSLYLRDAGNSRDWGLEAISREGGLRMTGATLDPVVFGSLCVWGGALAFSALFTSTSRRDSLLFGFSFVTCQVGTVLSLSRGAWLGAAITTLICLLFNGRWLTSIRFGLLVFGFAVLAVAIIDTVNVEEITAVFDILTRTVDKTVSEGNQQRQEQFDGVLGNLPTRILGNGLGDAGHVGERFSSGGMTDSGYPHITDGWYLKLLAEGGVPLFLAFSAYLVSSFVRMARALAICKFSRRRALLSTLFGIHLATVTQAFVSNVWDLYYMSQLLWLFSGMAVTLSAIQSQRPTTL